MLIQQISKSHILIIMLKTSATGYFPAVLNALAHI